MSRRTKSCAEYDGRAVLTHNPDGDVVWLHADGKVHLSTNILDWQPGQALVQATYSLSRGCTPFVIHGDRSQPEPAGGPAGDDERRSA